MLSWNLVYRYVFIAFLIQYNVIQIDIVYLLMLILHSLRSTQTGPGHRRSPPRSRLLFRPSGWSPARRARWCTRGRTARSRSGPSVGEKKRSTVWKTRCTTRSKSVGLGGNGEWPTLVSVSATLVTFTHSYWLKASTLNTCVFWG